MHLFGDNSYSSESGQSMFQFYKNSILKQSRIRFLMTNIIQQTYQQTKHPQTQDSILNFIRPYETRHNFNTMQSGLMKDISFEVYCFYRTFYNPDLEGFSALSLHQYHILFQLLEHELNFTETEVQGIKLKYVLFSAITCSNMAKFLF